jgi:hypothetical protein
MKQQIRKSLYSDQNFLYISLYTQLKSIKMENDTISSPGPLSLSSLAMEAIMKYNIITPAPLSIPANLLEDITNLRTCAGIYRLNSYSVTSSNPSSFLPVEYNYKIDKEISVTRPFGGGWMIAGSDCSLERTEEGGIRRVVWIEGSVLKIFMMSMDNDDNQDRLVGLYRQYRFEAGSLQIEGIFHFGREESFVLKTKYIKM